MLGGVVTGLLVGQDLPKANAALALGNIAFGNLANATEAAQYGAVYPLIVMLGGDSTEKENSAYALATLVQSSEASRIEIAREGAEDIRILGSEGYCVRKRRQRGTIREQRRA